MKGARRGSLSPELVIAVGLPLLTVVAGMLMLALAFGHGFTPVPPPDPVKLHGS